MKTKNKGRRKPPRRDVRLWLTTFGHGETARPGILITDDGACPLPLAFIEGDWAARHAAERIILGSPIEEVATLDLRDGGGRDIRNDRPFNFYAELSGNLMFPVKPFDRQHSFDESDPMFAAARYTPDSAMQGIARFSILTRTGLEQFLMESPLIRSGPHLEKAIAWKSLSPAASEPLRKLSFREAFKMLVNP